MYNECLVYGLKRVGNFNSFYHDEELNAQKLSQFR